MNYRNIINKASSELKKNSINSADIDAELLLSLSLNKTKENILLNLDKKLKFEEIEKYKNLIKRRQKKEPISQILGKKFFWKYEFNINKNVLSPRPETEFLVEEVLKIAKNSKNINILDIGVGSGCILISLLKEKIKWRGTGIDVSKFALKIAKYNAKIQQVENRIKFINSDIDNITHKKYDLVVSNPPYINKIEYNNLDLGVKYYEPREALYGGIDGLSIIEKIIKKSKLFLKINGFLAIEIGFGQYYKVSEILKKNNFYLFKTIKDYQNIKRCILAKKINNEKL
tara:strand:- start:80 stop:937 length:858 start_codon:yes stop_codon:yes gene_type:complete